MKYLTKEQFEFVGSVKRVEDWGDTSSNEIHNLSARYCWELHDKWGGEGFEWVKEAYKQPIPIIRVMPAI